MKGKGTKKGDLFLFLASWLITYIIAEVVIWKLNPNLGTFPKSGDKYCIAYSDYLPFTTPVNVTFHHEDEHSEFSVDYRFDSNGFRQTRNQIDSKRKVLLLGDSYTLGWGSHEDSSFAGRIARYQSVKGIQVINGGYTASCSPDAYYAYLDKNIKNIKPEAVFVFLYSGNDRRDMQTTSWENLDDKNYPGRIRSLRFYSDYQGQIIRLEHHEVPILYTFPIINKSRILIGLSNLFLEKEKAKAEAKYKLFKSMDGISELCKQNNSRLFVFIVPPKSLYNGVLDKEEKELILFKSVTRILQIPYYSLESDLDCNCYFKYDKHFNVLGNQIAFQKIQTRIDSVLRK